MRDLRLTWDLGYFETLHFHFTLPELCTWWKGLHVFGLTLRCDDKRLISRSKPIELSFLQFQRLQTLMISLSGKYDVTYKLSLPEYVRAVMLKGNNLAAGVLTTCSEVKHLTLLNVTDGVCCDLNTMLQRFPNITALSMQLEDGEYFGWEYIKTLTALQSFFLDVQDMEDDFFKMEETKFPFEKITFLVIRWCDLLHDEFCRQCTHVETLWIPDQEIELDDSLMTEIRSFPRLRTLKFSEGAHLKLSVGGNNQIQLQSTWTSKDLLLALMHNPS